MLSDVHIDNNNESHQKISSWFLSKESFSPFYRVSAHIWDKSKNLPMHLIISTSEMFR